MVRAGIPDFEGTQANVGRTFINLWPGDSVAHSAVLMELGVWRIETRHKMCDLRQIRDILLGDPSSQLRAIYNTYLQCCEAHILAVLRGASGPWGRGAPGLQCCEALVAHGVVVPLDCSAVRRSNGPQDRGALGFARF